jgi:G3E family GTPase
VDIRTPVTILTGFLGSGKTTLLNRALRHPAMARAVVVINEFGAISIDHALTATSNDRIVVLENGCLCCTVFGDLLKTLNTLYHMREAGEIDFERVLIETSGLAEMSPVIQAFLSDPTLEGLYRVATVIATVDAINADSTFMAHEVAVRQIAMADRILISKLDLVPEADRLAVRDALVKRLRQFNQVAMIGAADDQAIDPAELMRDPGHDPTKGAEAAREWLAASIAGHLERAHGFGHSEHEHMQDTSIASYCLVRAAPVARAALELLLSAVERQLGPSLLRVKGLVNVRKSRIDRR